MLPQCLYSNTYTHTRLMSTYSQYYDMIILEYITMMLQRKSYDDANNNNNNDDATVLA